MSWGLAGVRSVVGVVGVPGHGPDAGQVSCTRITAEQRCGTAEVTEYVSPWQMWKSQR